MRSQKSVKSRIAAPSRDPKKESVLNELSDLLLIAGYTVRREKLKQGHGWKVISGDCRAVDKQFIFVDRKLPQDEQISFLTSKIRALSLAIPTERFSTFPEHVQKLLGQGVLA